MNTLQIEAGIGYGVAAFFSVGTNGASSVFFYSLGPMFELNYRHYRKMKTVSRNGEPLKGNSGEFVFGQINVGLPLVTNIDYDVIPASLGIGYGIQRIYQNNVILTGGIGLGFSTNQQGAPISFIGDFGLGILLSKN